MDGEANSGSQEIPIQLVGTTFVYIEDGISYNGYQEVQPSPPAEREEVTHVDETVLGRHPASVDGGDSLTASASISIDMASKRMVDDLVDSENADDDPDNENPAKRMHKMSQANEAGNETTYGLFGSSTAGELEAFHRQSPITPCPLLPSIYNSPFAPQPGEGAPRSRPGTAKRVTPSHSQQHPRRNFTLPQPTTPCNIEVDSDTTSSMPEPTAGSVQMHGSYLNQPVVKFALSAQTNYTTGGRPPTTHGNDGHSNVYDCSFRSSALDFGGSGSVKGVPNVQTPPNGQGVG